VINLKNIMSDDSGITWGITLFLLIIGVAVLTFAAVGPVMDDVYDGFDQEYRDTYVSSAGATTLDTLYTMFGFTIIFPMLIGIFYVIVRAVRVHDENGGI